MRTRLLPILAALTVGLGACGGDDGGGGDEEQIRGVVETFYGNEEGVCDSISDRLLEEQFDSREQCEEAAADAEPQEGYEIGEISIDGDEAEVEVSVDDQTGTLLVAQEDGEWKVDGIGEQETTDEGTETVPTTPGE